MAHPASLDPDLATSQTGVVGHRVSSPDFVGRVEELDVLGAALDSAIGGRAATVLVGGEAGIGKSRLVEEFCQRARHHGALVTTGVCVPIDGGGLPYGPVVGILHDVTRQLGETETEAALGPLAAGLGLGVGLPHPEDRMEGYSAVPRMTEELAKTRLFASVLSGIVRLAERSAVVLVFEDLQWADSGSAELLSFLTRNLTDTRVLLVGTYRNDEIGRDHRLRPWLQEIRRHARVTHLPLESLDRDETAELIGGILGHLPDWTLVEAVWARAQGNAFFTEELTAARHNPSLSAELQGVIMTRVEGLSSDAQRLLRLAAVGGLTVDHRLLVAVGVLDRHDLEAALAETVDRQILVVDPSGAGYRFRHALLREAVDAALLPGERVRLHRQVAEALAADASLGASDAGFRVGGAGHALVGGRRMGGGAGRVGGGGRGRRADVGLPRGPGPPRARHGGNGPPARGRAPTRRAPRAAGEGLGRGLSGHRQPAFGRPGPSGHRSGRGHGRRGHRGPSLRPPRPQFLVHRGLRRRLRGLSTGGGTRPARSTLGDAGAGAGRGGPGAHAHGPLRRGRGTRPAGPGGGDRGGRPGRGGPPPLHVGVQPGVARVLRRRHRPGAPGAEPSPRSWPARTI